MKKYWLGTFYFLFILCVLFCFKSDVYAQRFLIDGSVSCGSTRGCSPISGAGIDPAHNDTNPKYINNGSNGIGGIAYCSDHNLNFAGRFVGGTVAGADLEYTQDVDYANARNCIYNSSNDGDCSEIVGYIIAHGQVYFGSKGYNSIASWYWTQIAVWAYLARFSPWAGTNTNAVNYYANSADVQRVIQNAWNEYAADRTGSVVNSDDVRFGLDYSNDTNFYYVPSTSSCNTGFYKTKAITVTNQQGRAINVSISTDNANVSICRNNSTTCSKTIDQSLPANSSVTFYLKSNVDVTENVVLRVLASYSDQVTKNTKYNSVRWVAPPPHNRTIQGMLTFLTSGGNSGVIDVNHLSSKSVTFSKVGISRTTCASSDTLDSNNSQSNPVKKVCASKSENESDYTANFSGCTCFGLDLGNNRYVNIIVQETAGFSFGKLTPDDVLYAGGGFALAENGIITQYASKVAWDYADRKNGVPYYYNANNLSDSDARNVTNEINNALLNTKLKSEIDLNFKTRNSNDYKDTNSVDVSLKLPLNNPTFANNLYQFSSGTIKTNQAYFSADGKVKYGISDDIYNIDGGNKYYVPMNYDQDTFPFNISVSDLSIVKGIEFWYQADCDKEVENKYKSLYYRTIDVKNPFPKAGSVSSKVPENWRMWYCGDGVTCSGNVTNQNRLKNTYQSYPNNSLYKITLNSDKLSKISSESDYYTSWSNIDSSGKSKFIEKYFDLNSSNASYCGLSKFNTDCDQY